MCLLELFSEWGNFDRGGQMWGTYTPTGMLTEVRRGNVSKPYSLATVTTSSSSHQTVSLFLKTWYALRASLSLRFEKKFSSLPTPHLSWDPSVSLEA